MELPAVDHRASPLSQWLRERRLRVAMWVAVAEAILIVVDVIPVWAALLVAASVVAFYVLAGRSLPSPTAREVAGTAAMSQALVAFVPILLVVAAAAAVVVLAVVALVAAVALAVLLTRR